MEIGVKIKELRLKNGMTQEKLADLLFVSVQTISRWETAVNYPDISLLPIIAHVFEVSTDYLLGVDIERNKEEIEKIKIKVQEYEHIGMLGEAISVLRDGIRRFPKSVELQLKLGSTLVYRDEKKEDELNESIEISQMVLSSTYEEKYRRDAIKNMFYAYIGLNNKDSAKNVYDQYIKNNLSPYDYQRLVLEGDELVDYLQQNFLNKVHGFWSDFQSLRRTNEYTNEEKIFLLDKFNKICFIIFDNEDYGFYSWYLYTINDAISHLYATLKNMENTLIYLEKAKDFAIKFDTRSEVIDRTSLLVNRIKEYKKESTTNSKYNICYELLQNMGRDAFQFVREEHSFKLIEEELKKYAKENIFII
jgi:transcriptional regulator with XRE-family HTH domain/uncharacterized protein (DUF2164 family)